MEKFGNGISSHYLKWLTMSTLRQPTIKYHIFFRSKYGYKLVCDFFKNEKILGKYDTIYDIKE